MHSRIFGITLTKKYNEEYEKEKETILDLTDDEVYEDYASHIADYVSDDTNLKDDIEWLKQGMGNLLTFTGDNTFKINTDELNKHIEQKLTKLQDKVNGYKDINDFVKDKYCLQRLLEDDFGFQFLWIQFGFENETDFLENHFLNLQRNITTQDWEYEIVKTFDYHF